MNINNQARYLIIQTIVFLVMVLFLYAAILKLADYIEFRAQISKSPLIMHYANILVWLVPGSEIIAAVLIYLPQTRFTGLILSFSIMFAFTIYIALMMIFSPWLPCSCGGILEQLSWGGHLVFNAAITILIAVGTILNETYEPQQLQSKIAL